MRIDSKFDTKNIVISGERPVLLVSFADTEAVQKFLPAVSALTESCDILFAGTDLAEPFLQGRTFVSNVDGWENDLAFSKAIVELDLDRCPFVLRLPLAAARIEDETTSQIALDSMLLGGAFEALTRNFREDPDLGVVGPDVLFKPLFDLLGDNKTYLAKVEKILGETLIAQDSGTFPWRAFAISGDTLGLMKAVLSSFDGVEALDRSQIPFDQKGSFKEAIGHIWSALPAFYGRRLGLSRRCLDDGKTIVRIGTATEFTKEVGREDSLSATEHRMNRAQPDFDLLKSEGDFDDAGYIATNRALIPDTFSALEHFVLFGDVARLSGTGRLNLAAYRLAMGSQLNPFDNSLCHWIVRGRQTLSLAPPVWRKYAESRKLFDSNWFAENNPETGSQKDAVAHYESKPTLWARASSPNFDPQNIPVLSRDAVRYPNLGLRRFLVNHFHNEKRQYRLLRQYIQDNDIQAARALSLEIEKAYGLTNGLVGIKAFLALKDSKWSQADTCMQMLWSAYKRHKVCVRHIPNLLADYNTYNERRFRDVQEAPPSDLKLEKVCIYTTIFGETDALLPILSPRTDISFVCFSDRPRNAPGWDVRVVEPKFDSSNLSAKYFKVLPHNALPEFSHSIFVDGNTLLLGDLDRLVTHYLAGEAFAMWRHPDRSDIYKESVAILQSGRHRSAEIFSQIQHYAIQGLPENTGLTEGSFIWRDHRDKPTREFMEHWWAEILSRSKRDQLSLGYLFWKREQRPAALPPHLGTSRRNAFFVKIPHKNPTVRPMPSKKAPITFLFHPDRQQAGSTVMRGEQLSQMVAKAVTDREVTYSTGLIWQGRVLFLTKGFLEKASVSDLQTLRDRGNFLIGDFVDAKPNKEKGSLMDALAAASFGSFEYLSRAFPSVPVFNLTHHVDPRIASGNEAQGFSAGYIGEEVNAVWTPQIKDRVALVQVNTKVRDDSWLQKLRHYNFHYAVRNTRDIDGSKPFLKGFTAAHCGAVIITQKAVGDAVYYLGEDYPYLLPSDPTEDEILTMLDQARGDFGGKRWLMAQGRMRQLAERTSRQVVVNEFLSILKA